MKIQIDGTSTLNKGAELMLYAILQEIERKHQKAMVLYNRLGEDSSYIQTSLNFKTRTFSNVINVLNKIKIPGILRRLSIPNIFFTTKYVVNDVDFIFDAGGFQFSDQWNISDSELLLWERYYYKHKQHGAKIILFPQAFGPFYTRNGKRIAEMLDHYTDVIFTREKVSFDYLIEAGVNSNKIKLYPDFTALVDGVIPKQYEYLHEYVCIIPNMRIIDKGNVSQEQYLLLICQLIQFIRSKGKEVFLLNHEGRKDMMLCKKINENLQNPIIIVNNLTALEVKGIISQSYLVISSRFHGVVSALNSTVPCLATSWSHKYEELFKNYDQCDCLIDANNIKETLEKVDSFLSVEKHNYISNKLKIKKYEIIEENIKMWEIVWNICMKYNI